MIYGWGASLLWDCKIPLLWQHTTCIWSLFRFRLNTRFFFASWQFLVEWLQYVHLQGALHKHIYVYILASKPLMPYQAGRQNSQDRLTFQLPTPFSGPFFHEKLFKDLKFHSIIITDRQYVIITFPNPNFLLIAIFFEHGAGCSNS